MGKKGILTGKSLDEGGEDAGDCFEAKLIFKHRICRNGDVEEL